MQRRGPCAVITCKNQGQHLIPQNATLRMQWLKALKFDLSRDNHRKQRKHAYICSDHFKPSDFITVPPLFEGDPITKRLKPKTVPSIFPWTVGQSIMEETVSAPVEDENVKFNATLTSTTYSRAKPALVFVEESPFMVLEANTQESLQDPLQLGDDYKIKIKNENNL